VPRSERLGGAMQPDENREKFEEFHRKNPAVYEMLAKYGRELLDAGHAKLSIALMAERVRWEAAIRTTGDRFKINNNFTAHYARRLADEFPEFRGRFLTRRSPRCEG
jgi:hypothetical protein